MQKNRSAVVKWLAFSFIAAMYMGSTEGQMIAHFGKAWKDINCGCVCGGVDINVTLHISKLSS